MPHGGNILVEALRAHGVRRLSCVAGESYLPVLDALVDVPEIEVIGCRHESGATFMAESWGLLDATRPGVALVTRGPGACNASIGIHAAMQSSSPVVMFVGLIGTADRGREAFQEFDLEKMFGALGKWSCVIDRQEDIPAMVAKAFHTACEGRPGPVVVGLPEDVLFPEVENIDAVAPIEIKEKSSDIAPLVEALKGAERPLLLVGGTRWRDEDCKVLEEFAGGNDLPVVAAFRRQDIFDHNHDCYIGELGTGPNPDLVEHVKQADVVVVLNERVDEITTQGYTVFQGGQKIIHVHPDKNVFGKGCPSDIQIETHIGPVVAALEGEALNGRWGDWRKAGRELYESWTAIGLKDGGWKGADVTQIFAQLRELLPEDAIVTTDAGNFSGWAQRYLRYGRPGRLLAPVSGAMGYAVPSAVGAAIAEPERVVVGLCGDGGFMMSGQEIATAMQAEAKPIILLFNNSVFGTIKMHQEREYPGRKSATDLCNPDFVKLGESYGAFAARVKHADDFEPAWTRALMSGKPALIEIEMDPAQVTTRSHKN